MLSFEWDKNKTRKNLTNHEEGLKCQPIHSKY